MRRKVVYKYVLPPWAGSLVVPRGSEVLHAGMQGREFCLWLMVPADELAVAHLFYRILGTGEFVDPTTWVERLKHVSTFTNPLSAEVWHVFAGF